MSTTPTTTTTTTTTTTRDRGDRYGPMEWAQLNCVVILNYDFTTQHTYLPDRLYALLALLFNASLETNYLIIYWTDFHNIFTKW